MSHTIKISGLSDELLKRLDARWKDRHYSDRSEYVRDLVRKDVLGEYKKTGGSLSTGIRQIFGALHEEAARQGYSDQQIADDVDQALSEVRTLKHKR